jgi:adenine phosphoribosyltransferase
MARQSGAEKYFIARKGAKAYMPDPICVEDQSITTAGMQKLYLGRDDAELICGKRILLIDDVYTTGSTLDACAAVLKEAGAARVDVLTFAAGADVHPAFEEAAE